MAVCAQVQVIIRYYPILSNILKKYADGRFYYGDWKGKNERKREKEKKKGRVVTTMHIPRLTKALRVFAGEVDVDGDAKNTWDVDVVREKRGKMNRER